MAKRELLTAIRTTTGRPRKNYKSRILDESVAATGHHRKHAIRELGRSDDDVRRQAQGQRIYDEAVIMVWEAVDRICGKRLKAAMLTWWNPWSDTAIWRWTQR